MPKEVAGENVLAIAGGFLTPMRKNGGIYLTRKDKLSPIKKGVCSKTSNPVIEITGTPTKSGGNRKIWFHKVMWIDMNNDGLLDVVTAYADTTAKMGRIHPEYKKTTGLPEPLMMSGSELSGKGYFVWYEQPKSAAWKTALTKGGKVDAWKKHTIVEGPDVNFVYADIDSDGKKEFLASEFLADDNEGALSLIYEENGSWKRRILDDKSGHGFDLQLKDLNKDGKDDIVFTNHQPPIVSEKKNKFYGRMYAYEIPKDIKKGEFKRHILIDNIKVMKKEAMQNTEMSPGAFVVFQPKVGDNTRKPTILLSGDGASEAFILSAKSEDPSNWEYNTTALYQNYGFDPKKILSVTGKAAVGDVDGDGYVELFIPWYEADYIDIWKISK